MSTWQYLKFKLGRWVQVDTIPKWVRQASDPPEKTNIPTNGSVDAVFTGDSLQYKIVTKRVPPSHPNLTARDGTKTVEEYHVRLKR